MKTLLNRSLSTRPSTRKRRRGATPAFPREIRAGVNMAASVRYKTAAVNPDGSVTPLRDWHKNLILDSGLNRIAVDTWASSFTFAAAGTGTNPTERDSGAITITATAGALVASANYFEAGDVGRMLRLDTGEQGYITAFTDPQNATWSGVDAAAAEGTIYYVNRVALQTEVKRTNTYRTSGGDNGSTWVPANGAWVHKRTYLFSAEVGAVTYREVGWSWAASPTDLFGMDVFSGGGDSLVAGQQYLISMELTVRYSPTAATTAPDVGTGGFNTEGDISLGTISTVTAVDGVGSTGASTGTGGGGSLEPSRAGSSNQSVMAGFTQAAYALPAATDGTIAPPTGISATDALYTLDSYTSGTFTRTKRGTFGVSTFNTVNAWGFIIYRPITPTTVVVVKFDAAQTKDNIHTLTPVFRFTWNRYFA